MLLIDAPVLGWRSRPLDPLPCPDAEWIPTYSSLSYEYLCMEVKTATQEARNTVHGFTRNAGPVKSTRRS